MAVTIKDLRFSIYLNNADAISKAMATQTALQKVGDEMQQLSNAKKKDTQEYRELKKSQDELITSLDKLKKETGLYGLSMKELQKLYKTIKNDRDRFIEGSNEWKELDNDLKPVIARMTKLNEKSAESARSLNIMNGGFRQMISGALAGIAALSGVWFALKKFMDLRMQLEDSQANLKSITGLDDKSVEWLTAQAKKLSTSSTEEGVRIKASSKEIVDGYTIIGSKRPELLKNKEAMAEVTKQALTLAATGVPVEMAFEVVTASMNQFNLGAKESSRIINVLAAGSLEGSAEADSLAGSMKNVGTVAMNSNLTLEQTVAALEVLASKQLLGEEAGTKLRGALLKMKEAGVGYVSGSFNMRDAIDEVNLKLKAKATALQRDAYLQKVFGIENITAGQILLDNAGEYDRLTKAVTGTNVAMTQAQISTNTTSVKLKQAQNNYNEVGMELVKNMQPALLGITNAGVEVLKVFSKHPSLLITIVSAIGFLTVAFLANTVASIASTAATKAHALATDVANSATVRFFKTLLSNPYVLIGTLIAGIIVLIYKLTTAQTDAQKAMSDFNKEYQKESLALDNVFEAYKRANSGSEEKKKLLDLIKAKYGPYIQNLIDEKGNITDIEKAQIQANTALRDSIALKMQNASVNDLTTKEVEKQAKLLSNLREYIAKTKGNEVANIITEQIGKSFSQNQTDLKKGYLLAMDILKKNAIPLQGITSFWKGETANTDVNDLFYSFKRIKTGTDAIKSQFVGIIQTAKTAATIIEPVKNDKHGSVSTDPGTIETQKKELDLITQTIDNAHTDRLTKLKTAKIKENQTEVEYNNKTLSEDKAYYDLKIAALQKYRSKVTDKNFKSDIDKQISELNNKKAELDVKYQEKINKILLDADPVKKENLEYDDRLRELGIFNKKREDLTDTELQALELLEKQHNDNLFKINDQAKKNSLKQAIEKFDEEYKSINDKYNKEIDSLSKKAEVSKKTGTPFSNLKKIDADPEIILINKRIEAIKKEMSAKEKAGLDTAKLNDELIKNENQLTDTYVSKYQQRAQLFTKFGEDIGSAIGNLATGNKDALKSTLVSMINLGLDYLKAQAEMAIAGATVQSLAMPDSIATFGATGIARSIILVGLIEAAFGAAKTIIGNTISGGKYSGGYTGGNDPTEVRGQLSNGENVHGVEFVANHKAVRNPQVKKFLDVFDMAQKNGTIHLMNTTQILEKVRSQPSPGYQAGGYATGSGGSAGTVSNEVAIAMLAQASKSIDRLNAHLDAGIQAYAPISGNYGLAKQLDRYGKMVQNASRG